MNIHIQRIYNDDSVQGYRVLVDRLWPRGISKEEARLDDWWKEIAPSNGLRKWFNHDKEKWNSFRKKYLKELSNNKDKLEEYICKISGDNVILLYATKDSEFSHARILKKYIEDSQESKEKH